MSTMIRTPDDARIKRTELLGCIIAGQHLVGSWMIAESKAVLKCVRCSTIFVTDMRGDGLTQNFTNPCTYKTRP